MLTGRSRFFDRSTYQRLTRNIDYLPDSPRCHDRQLTPCAVPPHHVTDWLAVLLWASVIFFFSTDLFSSDNTSFIVGSLLSSLVPGLSTQDVEFFHVVVRKLGHFSEYFIFTVLLVRALRNDNGGEIKARHLLISIAIATLYAISDEFHQSFVRSRSRQRRRRANRHVRWNLGNILVSSAKPRQKLGPTG